NGGGEPGRVDGELAGKLFNRVRARHPGRDFAAARRIDEGETVDILLIENQKAWQVGVPVFLDVVVAQGRHHILEIGLVDETDAGSLHDDRVRAQHLAYADDAKQRLLAGLLAGNVETEEHREIVADGADLGAKLGAHDDAVAVDGRRKHREKSGQAFVGLRHG